MSRLEEMEGYAEALADEDLVEAEEFQKKLKFIENKIELISDPWVKIILKEMLELMS